MEFSNTDPKFFGDLWDRFRKVAQTVADVRALKEEVRSKAEKAEAKARKFASSDEGLKAKAEKWREAAQGNRAKEHVLQSMMNYFLENEDPRCPPPAFGQLSIDQRQSYRSDQRIMGTSGKRGEIYEAILKVLKRDDVPTGKVAFYKAADRERGLTGNGRATENWIRDRMDGDLPDPAYWRSLLLGKGNPEAGMQRGNLAAEM